MSTRKQTRGSHQQGQRVPTETGPMRDTRLTGPNRTGSPRFMAFIRLLSLVFSIVLSGWSLAPVAAFAQAPVITAPAGERPAPSSGQDEAGANQLELLLRILEDDAARARLLEALRTARATEAAADPAVEPLRNEIAKNLSTWSQSIGAGGAAIVQGLNQAANEGLSAARAAARYELTAFAEAAVALGAAVALTFGLLWLARRLIARFMRPSGADHPPDPLARRILSLLIELTAGAFAILIAAAGGFALLALLGLSGLMLAAGLGFIAAFAVAEAVKLALRTLFAPAHVGWRPLRLSDTSANYWTIWLSRLTVALVYPLVFVAPALARAGLSEIAQATVVLSVVTAVLMGVAVVLQNRALVRERLDRHARELGGGNLASFYRLLARTWHIFAILAIVGMAILSLTEREGAFAYILSSAMESAVIIALGRVALLFISRALGRGMALPDEVRQRLPLLEAKLKAFVPAILLVVRLVVVALVAAAVARAWGAFDAFAWLGTPAGVLVVATMISTGLVLTVGVLVYIVVTSWIENRLDPVNGTAVGQRERTLLALFRSAFTVGLAVTVGMMALSELGVNIGPLLAGAGVVGLAIGFGAQKLVQDVITGVFIQLENVMNEGDVVTAGGVSGVVEKLTIRSVGLRDLSGSYHSIPFSTVDKVTNMMRYFAFYVADVGVAYRENIADVKIALEEAFDRLAAEPEHAENIIGPFEMLGVERLADSAVIVRCRIKTKPGKQWPTGRAYNELVKQVFDERGIEIPFPHVTLYPGRDKDGAAPPLRIITEEATARRRETVRREQEVGAPMA